MITTVDGASARAAARAKVFQPAEMRSGTEVSRVHLLDLSRVGALVYARATPAVGSVVRLSCLKPLGAARVAWVDGKRFGVAFATPLTQAQFDEILAPVSVMAARAMA